MPKLTTEQITAIDKALWDIEIRFLDIRIEMIDHAATALEGMEGDFNDNLNEYIADNKKELKKNYSRLRRNTSLKAVKMLFSKMMSLRFVAILAVAYATVFAAYKHEGLEETSFMVFMAFIFAIPLVLAYTIYMQFTRQRKLFSTAERFMAIMSSLGYTLFIALRVLIDKLKIDDAYKLLYYAFVISVYCMAIIMYISLTKSYKLKYQGI